MRWLVAFFAALVRPPVLFAAAGRDAFLAATFRAGVFFAVFRAALAAFFAGVADGWACAAAGSGAVGAELVAPLR